MVKQQTHIPIHSTAMYRLLCSRISYYFGVPAALYPKSMFIDEFNNTNEDCIILLDKLFKSYNVVWNVDMIPLYFYLDDFNIVNFFKRLIGNNKKTKIRISIGDILNSIIEKKWIQKEIHYY